MHLLRRGAVRGRSPGHRGRARGCSGQFEPLGPRGPHEPHEPHGCCVQRTSPRHAARRASSDCASSAGSALGCGRGVRTAAIPATRHTSGDLGLRTGCSGYPGPLGLRGLLGPLCCADRGLLGLLVLRECCRQRGLRRGRAGCAGPGCSGYSCCASVADSAGCAEAGWAVRVLPTADIRATRRAPAALAACHPPSPLSAAGEVCAGELCAPRSVRRAQCVSGEVCAGRSVCRAKCAQPEVCGGRSVHTPQCAHPAVYGTPQRPHGGSQSPVT